MANVRQGNGQGKASGAADDALETSDPESAWLEEHSHLLRSPFGPEPSDPDGAWLEKCFSKSKILSELYAIDFDHENAKRDSLRFSMVVALCYKGIFRHS